MEQQDLLVECRELPDLNGKKGKDVLITMTEWGAIYSECKERHKSLVEAVK